MSECRVIAGDCMQVLPNLDSGAFDAVITDPPYNVGLRYVCGGDYKLHYDSWCREWFGELKRVCRGPILISCGIANLGMWCHAIEQPAWVLCWHKPASSKRCAVGFNNWEPILLYGDNYNRRTVDVIRTTEQASLPVNHIKKPIAHPCPKPLEWAAKLIADYCPEGGRVLDPFAGSGTVGVACALSGRSFVGIELSADYCAIARKRIADTVPPLFPLAPSVTPSLFGEDAQ